VWILSNFPQNVNYARDYKNEFEQISRSKLSDKDKAESAASLIMDQKSEKQSRSFIGIIGHAIEPVMQPLGLDWRLSVSILSGLAAKEVVVSTLGVIFQEDTTSGNSSLVEKIQNQRNSSGKPLFSPLAAFSLMLFILTYFPCIGVVAAIRRESGNWKWPLFIVFYTTGMAWLLSFIVYQTGMFFLG
jgi:ferrous iron transport protein B